jgi:hypothetical protein
MQVHTNTDRTITGSNDLSAQVEAVVAAHLERFAAQITRVEVHLNDENGTKAGAADIRCLMEARLAGRPPTAVTNHAPTVSQALDGAAEKLARTIASTLGRLREF